MLQQWRQDSCTWKLACSLYWRYDMKNLIRWRACDWYCAKDMMNCIRDITFLASAIFLHQQQLLHTSKLLGILYTTQSDLISQHLWNVVMPPAKTIACLVIWCDPGCALRLRLLWCITGSSCKSNIYGRSDFADAAIANTWYAKAAVAISVQMQKLLWRSSHNLPRVLQAWEGKLECSSYLSDKEDDVFRVWLGPLCSPSSNGLCMVSNI